MGQIDLINGGVAGYLLISAILLQWLGRQISASRQHQLAFASIIILVAGVIPLLKLPAVAPGIIFSLGMMLVALHLSAYYSGTPKNSGHLYSVILGLAAVVMTPLMHPVFHQSSFIRFLSMGGVGLLLIELERVLSGKSHRFISGEKNLLWIWFLASVLSLWDSQVKLLPDMLFLILLLLHMEKRWRKQGIPAPIVALYGILFTWFAHFTFSGIPGDTPNVFNGNTTSVTQYVISGSVVALGLGIAFRSKSITKRFLYLFISQEILLLSMGIENMFIPSAELISLLRILLFVSLTGLFVMIESGEEPGLDRARLRGLIHERPRFSSSVIIVSIFFALYPLVYIGSQPFLSQLFLVAIVVVGSVWAVNLILLISESVDRDYRILRPSLSIWSTVVFTILWSAVVVLEIVSRNHLNG